MKRCVLPLLLVLILAGSLGLLPVRTLVGRFESLLKSLGPAPSPPAEPLYRWVDARGSIHYASRPPAGIRAERIEGRATLSVIPSPPAIKEPVQIAVTPAAPMERTFQEQTIEQATR